MAANTKKKIAINTGGGDAPGLNAVIRACALAALQRGWEVYGIRDGYNGLMKPEDYPRWGPYSAHPQPGPRDYPFGRNHFRNG